jgi:soluble lytic murein transglycosylase-like protein
VPTTAPVATAPAPAAAPAPDTGAPPALGGYTVRPGDTLSGLAAGARIPLAQMAAMNGLDPNGPLLIGTVLKLPTGAPTPVRAAQPAPAKVVPAANPVPVPGRVTSQEVSQIAAGNGVPGSLASAIAWQESGFNNAMVSSANARGVMQVMPGTWSWIQSNLAQRPLNPDSPADNVHAGTLFLGSLLRQTGGDPAMAAAGYYQGLASVRRIGMLPETQRYVANVMALRARFGG